MNVSAKYFVIAGSLAKFFTRFLELSMAAIYLLSPVLLGLVAHRAPLAQRAVVPARTSLLHSVAAAPPVHSEPTEAYDEWTQRLDYPGFRKEVHELGQRLSNEQGEADVKHLQRMILWSNLCGGVGIATMWMSSPLGRLLSIVGLSTWTCTRWTMVGHHICHGGYNRQDTDELKGRYTANGFAVGTVYRRVRDWLDWRLPEAWHVEHNNLHHYRLGESGDPDLVERNLEMMRDIPLPRPLKYVAVAFLAAMWKWYYYAPNTYKQLKIAQMRKDGAVIDEQEAHEAFTLPHVLFSPTLAAKWNTGPLDFIKRVMGPMLLCRFLLLPAPLALLRPSLYGVAMANLLLADVLSNIHSFIIIATNHCGDDMYKFDNSIVPRSGSFYMRAVTSSSNFRTANGVGKPVHGFTADLNDFLHGWLNYQIEHHAWPQLSMLSYQKAAPELRAICQKYGVPYVQQNVFQRLKKTADIMVGATSMRPFPASWEYVPDRFTWADQRSAAQPEVAAAAVTAGKD